MRRGGLVLAALLLANLVPAVYAQPTITAIDFSKFNAELDPVKGELTFTRWKDTQVKITVSFLQPTSNSLTDGKTELTYANYKCSVYETEEGIEWDLILAEPPPTNSFSLKVENSLTWNYQPPLNQEHQNLPKGWFANATHVIDDTGYVVYHRPLNVVGSYAVVDYSRQGPIKFMHVYRPKIFDAKGGWTWGTLNYNGGVLTITVNPYWLENAVYPVTIDPSFGYTTLGGSTVGLANYAVAYQVTAPENGNVTNITFGWAFNGANQLATTAIYSDSGGEPNSKLATSVEITKTQGGGAAWHECTITGGYGVTGSTVYWLAATADYGNIAYDAGSSQSRRDWGAYPNLPATWDTGGDTALTHDISIYANYTTGAAPTAYERNATLAVTYSVDATRTYIGTRQGTQALSFAVDAIRYVVYPRAASLGLTFTQDASRMYRGARAVTQGLSFVVDAAASAVTEFIRQVTLSLSLSVDAIRSQKLIRSASKVLSFLLDGTYTGEGFTLLVRVTDTIGRALEGAMVSIWGPAGTLEIFGATNSTGYYDAGIVSDGNYTISCLSENYQPSIDIYTISTSELIVITLKHIEEAVYMYLPWVLVTLLGCITLASPRMIQSRSLRMLSYPISVVLWLTAAYIWAVLQANSSLFPITYLHLIPILISTAWGFIELGASLSKRDKYERI